MFLGIHLKVDAGISDEVELIVKMSLRRIRNCPGPEVHCVFLEEVMIFVQVCSPRSRDFIPADRMGSPSLLFREPWEKEWGSAGMHHFLWTVGKGWAHHSLGNVRWAMTLRTLHGVSPPYSWFGIFFLKGMDLPSVSHPGTGNKLSLRKKRLPASLCMGSSWAQTPRRRNT